MSEKEIFEGNKLIAEFMGDKFISATNESVPRVSFKTKFKTYSACETFCKAHNKKKLDHRQFFPVNIKGKMEYHSSWDWLMPVVKKVYSHCNQRTATQFDFDLIEYSLKRIDHSGVYNAVIDFIKWNNSLSK